MCATISDIFLSLSLSLVWILILEQHASESIYFQVLYMYVWHLCVRTFLAGVCGCWSKSPARKIIFLPCSGEFSSFIQLQNKLFKHSTNLSLNILRTSFQKFSTIITIEIVLNKNHCAVDSRTGENIWTNTNVSLHCSIAHTPYGETILFKDHQLWNCKLVVCLW